MRKTFVVGKLTGSTAEIVLLDSPEVPLAGPSLLQALLRPLAPAVAPSHLPGLSTVH